jgi:hypothetical protein
MNHGFVRPTAGLKPPGSLTEDSKSNNLAIRTKAGASMVNIALWTPRLRFYFSFFKLNQLEKADHDMNRA